LGFIFGGRDGIASGRNGMPPHEILGEDFAAFELGGGLSGSENEVAVAAKEIDDAIDERRFGADNGEVGVDLIGESQQVFRFGRRGTDAGSDLRAARVAGRDDDFPDGGAAVEPPSHGMFTPATAENEDFHGAISFAGDSLGYL
jgi:hypothetical protein